MGWFKKMMAKKKAKERFRSAQLADPGVKKSEWASGKWQRSQAREMKSILRVMKKKKGRKC